MNKYSIEIVRRLFLVCICVLFVHAGHAKDFTVVLDPGHGGHDAGAVGTFSKEKNINLKIALEVGRLISANMSDVKVIYTRKTDVFIPLTQRATIANRANADLFISIHANSVENKARSPQGVETYSLGLARSDENLAVAKRENAVILMEDDYKSRYAGFNPNSSESYIIFEFMQDKYMEQSVHMASLVQKQMSSHCKRTNKGVKQAGFLVLRATSMPSVLVEVGFISHPDEERYLNSESGSNTLAEGIYRAFCQYKYEYDIRTKKSSVIVPFKDSEVDNSIKAVKTVEENRPVVAESKDSATSQDKSFSLSRTTEGEILFKIQIMASNTLIRKGSAQFKGLDPVEYYKEGGYYKYTYGCSGDYNEIYRQRKEILPKFASAFIIAFRNGEKMDINQAIRAFKMKRNNR